MKRTLTRSSLTLGQEHLNDPPAERRKIRRSGSPCESVIRNLLNYSKALAVLKSNETGYIHMVMN